MLPCNSRFVPTMVCKTKLSNFASNCTFDIIQLLNFSIQKLFETLFTVRSSDDSIERPNQMGQQSLHRYEVLNIHTPLDISIIPSILRHTLLFSIVPTLRTPHDSQSSTFTGGTFAEPLVAKL
uniref:Uncharacterized protein n=1 Tax=Rhipicephalus microplus TaxID=6941 RepID=A0A6G5AGC1_RHIMP